MQEATGMEGSLPRQSMLIRYRRDRLEGAAALRRAFRHILPIYPLALSWLPKVRLTHESNQSSCERWKRNTLMPICKLSSLDRRGK